MRHVPGFSMVEVLIAAGILMVVGLAVVGAMIQSSKEVQTTSDYTLSFLLAQKVGEELIQSGHENRYFDRSIGEESGLLRPIREHRQSYFAALEDSQAPWGRLDPAKDLGIERADEGLFRLYSDFSLILNSRKDGLPEVAGPGPALEHVEIRYEWPGVKDRTRAFSFPVTLALNVESPRNRPDVLEDLPGLDQKIRDLMYPGVAGPDLTSVVNTVEAQISVVRDLGAILVVISNTLDQFKELDRAIRTQVEELLRDSFVSAQEKAIATAHLAKIYEKKAAIAWQALLYVKEPVWRISSSFMADSLGTRQRPDGKTIEMLLSRAARFPDDLVMNTMFALETYIKARALIPQLGAMPFWQLNLELKILDLAELRTLVLLSPDVTFIKEWLEYIGEIYRGRNRFLEDFIRRERTIGSNLDELQAQHPQIKDRIAEVRDASQGLRELRTRVYRGLVSRGP